MASAGDEQRGFGHGTFVPLAVSWPAADVPTMQKGLDPATHVRIGRVPSPPRDEGVLIVGSGMSYHNMQGYGSAEGARHAAALARRPIGPRQPPP